MFDRDHTSDAAPELTGFLARHPDTTWLDALVVDLAGTLRGKRYPREEMATLFRGGMQFPMSSYYLEPVTRRQHTALRRHPRPGRADRRARGAPADARA